MHGFCINKPEERSFKCLCENHWEGQYCTIDVNECGNASNSHTVYYDICSGYGGCYNLAGSFICSCMPGRFGAKCDATVADFPHFLNISVTIDGIILNELSTVYQLKYELQIRLDKLVLVE